jgi:hypothetical protein
LINKIEGNKMIIKTIEEMESFVSKNKDFFWDGWTVVKRYASDKGRTSKDGVRVKGVWYIEQRFDPSNNGWILPDRKGDA